MKRIHLILVAFFIFVLIAGCGRGRTDQPARPPGTDNARVTEHANGGIDTSSGGQGAQVIAKSGTSVSSKDKEAILNEISKELDLMLQNINNLEDVSDEDLEF